MEYVAPLMSPSLVVGYVRFTADMKRTLGVVYEYGVRCPHLERYFPIYFPSTLFTPETHLGLVGCNFYFILLVRMIEW